MTNLHFRLTSIRTSLGARGAASVEAVVILPVLIILFVSVTYIRNQVLAQQAADNKARSCAWAYSANNCEAVPAGCEELVKPVTAGTGVASKVSDALSSSAGWIGPVIKPVIEAVLDPVLENVFGRALEANTVVAFERPGLFGGGTQSARGKYRLACNIKPETAPEVAKDAWNALVSKIKIW